MNRIIEEALAPRTKSRVLLHARVGFLASVASGVRKARDLGFLNHTRIVSKRVEDTDNLRTQYSRWCHVIALIKASGDVVRPVTLKTFGKKIDKLKAAMQRAPNDNTLTDDQAQRYRTLPELEEIVAEALQSLLESNGFTDGDLSQESLDQLFARKNKIAFVKALQRIALMACYTLQPALRADWTTLQLTSRIRSIPAEGNWLYFRRSGQGYALRVVMQDFKNERHMGKTIIEVSQPLAKVLSMWLKVLQRMRNRVEYLFIWSFKQGQMVHVSSRNSLARRLPRIFEEYAGTPLTVNDMRHIHENALQTSDDYQRMTVRERERAHAQLLHSHHTGITYNRV